MLYWISLYTIEMFKIYILIFLFFSFIVMRKGKWIVFLSIVGIVITAIISLMVKNETTVSYLVTMIILIIVMSTIKSIRHLLVIILIYLIISLIDTCIAVIVALFVKYSIDLLLEDKVLAFVIDSISLYIYIFMLLIFSRRIMSRIKIYLTVKKTLILMMCIIAVSVIFIPIQIIGLNSDNSKFRVYMVMGSTVSVFMFLVICIMIFYNIDKKKYYDNYINNNEKFLKRQKKYYQSKMSEYIEVKKFKHDIRSIILYLTKSMEDKKIEEAKIYLDNITGKMKMYSNSIETGNRALNIVIEDIFGEYEDIPIEWEGVFPEAVIMSDIDICILFSNLFKNAIESEKNVHEIHKKSENCYCPIKVDIKYIEKTIYFTIKNRVEGEVIMVGNILKTSKQDEENHGFGSMNVYEIITKYKGDIKYIKEENHFIVDIILHDIME